MTHVLEGVGTLVVAGDGREELVQGWRAEADRLWDELQEACRVQGVQFVALTGNHDPEASTEGWLSLSDDRILVTHGDMIYETASPWSRELFERRALVQELLGSRECQNLHDRWECALEVGKLLRPNSKMAPNFLGYLKLAFWPPERLIEVGKVWAGFAQEGGRFLERFQQEAEVLVCGHFHRSGKFSVGDRTVWNTGSLMKMSKGLAVDFDGKNLSFHPIHLNS